MQNLVQIPYIHIHVLYVHMYCMTMYVQLYRLHADFVPISGYRYTTFSTYGTCTHHTSTYIMCVISRHSGNRLILTFICAHSCHVHTFMYYTCMYVCMYHVCVHMVHTQHTSGYPHTLVHDMCSTHDIHMNVLYDIHTFIQHTGNILIPVEGNMYVPVCHVMYV